MISPRDEIWIDMMQFDVRAADRLWEGTAPAQGAPGWYDDVSGLIETASGPAEPRELVDEPIVVEDMHRTTLGRRPRHCRRRRTVGRVIAMKAAFATTAGVFGVAAAAAATTGIVATVASVVVPVIEEHVLRTQDGRALTTPVAPAPGPVGESQDPSLDNQLLMLAAAPAAGPTTAVSTPPSEPAVEAADAARPLEPPLVEPVAADPAPPIDPAGVTPEPSSATRPAPPAAPAPVAPAPVAPAPIDPPPGDTSPRADAPPDKVVRPHDTAAHHDAPDKASDKSAEHPRPAHSRRPD